MGFMENTAENRFSLDYIEIIHKHLVITPVLFAGHIQEFILFTAESNILQSSVQLLKFSLGLFHIFLEFGQELFPELLLCRLFRPFHFLFIIQQL